MDICLLEWNVCRICLREEGDSKYYCVFNKDKLSGSANSNNDNLTIAEQIMACSKIIVSIFYSNKLIIITQKIKKLLII